MAVSLVIVRGAIKCECGLHSKFSLKALVVFVSAACRTCYLSNHTSAVSCGKVVLTLLHLGGSFLHVRIFFNTENDGIHGLGKCFAIYNTEYCNDCGFAKMRDAG